jgi:hypothetical protein
MPASSVRMSNSPSASIEAGEGLLSHSDGDYPQSQGYPLLRIWMDGVPMRLVMETVGKVVPGIGLYLKCQYTERGQDTMSALR